MIIGYDINYDVNNIALYVCSKGKLDVTMPKDITTVMLFARQKKTRSWYCVIPAVQQLYLIPSSCIINCSKHW